MFQRSADGGVMRVRVGLARFGADVAICARELSPLERCRQAIEAADRKAVPFALDVRGTGQVDRAIEDAVAALGGLDILINNAGVEQVSPSLEVDAALWDRIVDTKLKGAFFCAQAAARRMGAAGARWSAATCCAKRDAEFRAKPKVPRCSSHASGPFPASRPAAVPSAAIRRGWPRPRRGRGK
jgi:NAD(P)-dependent dehydrogenase (short-subunit alcohol dehydrogenase family)